jgi:hypothetical protein
VIWTNSSVSGPSNQIRLASTHRLTPPWTLTSLREIAVAAQGFCRECEQSSSSLDPAADRAESALIQIKPQVYRGRLGMRFW